MLFTSRYVDFATDFQFKLSRRVGSKVPAFAHFHTILSRYSLCHDEREKEKKRRGGEREREREREREEDREGEGERGEEETEREREREERERKRGRETVER